MVRFFAGVLALLFLLLATAGVTLAGPPKPPAPAPGQPRMPGLTEFPLPSGAQSYDITTGPDGNLWYTDYGRHSVGRMTTAGVITEYSTAPNIPSYIAAGPDGNLWVAAADSTGQQSTLYVITSTGILTTVNLPLYWRAGGLVAGPDGNLWVTAYNSNRVGRVTTAGAITIFSVTQACEGSITLGPDGALWFTEDLLIGRMTTGGVLSEYPLTGYYYPSYITTGGDGNLWFASIAPTTYAITIERITPAGAITDFNAPNISPVRGLTLGSDGNVWATADYNLLARILPDGSMTIYRGLQTGSDPSGVVNGPDGAIWFSEAGAGRIGRLDVTAPTATPTFTPTITRTPTITTTPTITPTPTATSVPPTCGPAWRAVAVPNVGSLNRVVSISSDDVWATSDTTPLHWNGQVWTTVPLPSGSGTIQDLAAGSPSMVWILAYTSTNSGTVYSTYHWTGSGWTAYPLPPLYYYIPPEYTNITAYSTTDVWVAGSGHNEGVGSYSPAIFHWNGTAWTAAAMSPRPQPGHAQPKGGGCPPEPCFDYRNWAVAVGPGEAWVRAQVSGYPAVFIPTWSRCLVTGCSALPFQDWVIGVVSPTDVWISAGSSGMQHWNGSSFTTVSAPNVGYVTDYTVVAANDIWARTGGASWLHWDGAVWSAIPRADGNALDGTGPDDMWSVGANADGSSLALHYSGQLFTDVPNLSTFSTPVDALACRGIISGYPCGGAGEPCDNANRPYFRPANPVSRGQAAKLVAGAAGITSATGGQTFADVPPSGTFYAWIEPLAAAGVINGYPCGTRPDEPCDSASRPYFRPGAGVTRGQLSKIVALAAHYADPPAGQSFEDVPPDSTFYTWVQQVGSRGIIGGYACGGSGEPCVSPTNRPYFRPGRGATRGQTAKIVYGVFILAPPPLPTATATTMPTDTATVTATASATSVPLTAGPTNTATVGPTNTPTATVWSNNTATLTATPTP